MSDDDRESVSDEIAPGESGSDAAAADNSVGSGLVGSPNSDGDQLFKGLLIGSGSILLLLMVFWLGMIVGEQKAQFTLKWGEKYNEHFGGHMDFTARPGHGLMPAPKDKIMKGGHGSAGQVLKVSDDSMVILGANNLEQIVILDEETNVIKGRTNVEPSEIQVGDYAVVIGAPTADAEIDAKMIKLFDKPPRGMMSSPDISGPMPMGRL